MAKENSELLSCQIALRVSTDEVRRIDAVAERSPIIGKHGLGGAEGRLPTGPSRFRHWLVALALSALVAVVNAACGGSRAELATPSAPARSSKCDDASRLKDGGQFAVMPDGVRVWYKLVGPRDAPVIAYLHGGPGYNAYAFEASAGHILEKKFRLLYIDQRGCGRSGFEGAPDAYGMQKTVEDIERVRTAVGADSLTLIGHSFGGIVAAEYARRFPQNVTAAVFVDTTPAVGRALAHQVAFIDDVADTAFPAKATEIHAVARGDGPTFGKLQKLYELIGRVPLQRRLHFASPSNQDAMEALDAASGIMGCTSDGIVPAFQREGYLDAPASVGSRLPVPSLLIAGQASEVVGKENIERAAKSWGSELRWFEGAGHFVYFEKPREFGEAVADFVSPNIAALRFDTTKGEDADFQLSAADDVDPIALRDLMRGAEQSNTDAVVILKDGKLVAERYFGRPRSLIETMSVTKSVVSLAVGLLLSEGKIPSLDVPLSKYFGEFKTGSKAKVTLRHILSHTSGIEHRPRAGVLTKQADRLAYVRSLPVVEEPGTKFSYNNEAVQLLSAIVASAAGQPVDVYLGERIFKPLGIADWEWSKDSKGNRTASWGLALHARDLAKIGLMLAQGGRWKDRQIVPEKWVTESTSPARSDMSWSGFLWWVESEGPWLVQSDASLGKYAGDWFPSATKLRPLDGKRFGSRAAYWMEAGALLDAAERAAFVERVRDDRLPFETIAATPIGFRADGWLGQYLVVFPKLGLVGVRQHREREGGDVEKENETNGFKDFMDRVRRLQPRARSR